MRKKRVTRFMALLLTFVMVFTSVIPMNVSATATENSATYHSQAYYVDGITAYAYDGADLSQSGLSFEVMKDNQTLSKALYYSYGMLGYSKEYEKIDTVYNSYGAKVSTDKLAISEMVLTKIMNEDESAYDSMTKDFLDVVKDLPDFGSDFVPYYILSEDKEVVGYTSTSETSYEMPKEETTEETSSEETSEEVTSEEVTSEETSEEATTEETTEEIDPENDKGGNLKKADGTYEDGIRNRNRGLLGDKLGGISTDTVLTEIDKHWNDDTYFGRKEYKHYDFVSTLLSNISGKKIDTNVMEYANKHDLEVYQFSGSVDGITKAIFGLKYSYISMGDVLVVEHDGKEYCGIYTELEFYQKNLDKPNNFCMYNEIPGYETIDGEFDAKGNDLAWMWFDGETTKITPMEFDGNIKLSIIKIERGMNITAEGRGYKDLGDGAMMYQNDNYDDVLEDDDEEGLAANTIKKAFTGSSAQFNEADATHKAGAKIIQDSDGTHAKLYWRIVNADDHKGCAKADHSGNYCCDHCDNKSSLLITCGAADLTTSSTSSWKGGTIKITSVGAGSVTTDKDIKPIYANTKNDLTRTYAKLLINPDELIGEVLPVDRCRDKKKQVPGNGFDGYYELYLISSTVTSTKIEYKIAVLWYSNKRLLEDDYEDQRLCSSYTFTVPAPDSVTPKRVNASVSVSKKLKGVGGKLYDGQYKFQLLNEAQNAVLGEQIVTVTGGVSNTATFSIPNCFTYTTTTGTNSAPTYNAVVQRVFYLREVSAPAGMTCDPNKLTTLEVDNYNDYINYIQRINEYNITSYSNGSASKPGDFTSTPVIHGQGSTFTINPSNSAYPNAEIKPGVGFTKVCASSCAAFVAGNPNYSLEGAEYRVYTDAACTQLAEWYESIIIDTYNNEQATWTYGGQTDAIFTTNADGSFKERTNVTGDNGVANLFAKRVCMDPGTYWIREEIAPKGYKLNTNAKQFTVAVGNQSQNVIVEDEAVIDPFAVSFNKKLTGGLNEIAGVKVSDATFKVEYFTDAGFTNKKYEASFKVADDGTITFTKDTAFNSTFPDACWQGMAGYVQLHVPAGYLRVTEVNNDANANVGVLRKAVVTLNDGTKVDISKGIDFKVEYSDPSNNAREKFICITANNTEVNENTVENIEDERVKRFDICFTKKAQDGEPMSGVPFIIENTKTGEKHLVVSDENGFVTTRRTDKIKVDGDNTKTLDEYKAKNAPYYNSLDSYIKDNVEDMTDKDLVNNKVAPAPIWFYGTSNDVSTEASFVKERDEDTYHGSLVYSKDDEYVIYEVPTKKSNGKQIVKKGDIKFGCQKDNEMLALTDGAIDATIINYDEQKIITLSRDAASKSRFTKQTPSATVIDNFEVTNLKYGHSYTVKGVLVARNTTVVNGVTYQAGELIKDSDDKYITSHSAFTTNKTAADGSTVDDKYKDSRRDKSYTSYETDASGNITAHTSLIYNFNTSEFSRCNAVWYTYLCDGIEGADGVDLVITDGKVDKDASKVIKERTISEDNGYYDYVDDESLTNDKEFVDVVCVDTSAFTKTFNTANENVGKETEIYDKVVINGLANGEEYQLVSKLVNPDTNEVLKDADGNEIIGKLDGDTDKFTYSENADGCWEGVVKYPKIDTTAFEGKSIVCLQYLYDNNGILVGESTKLTNDKETIHFPVIHTTATGHEGEKALCQYGEIEIIDEVRYESLALNREYTIVGTLHYKDKDGNEQVLHYKDGSEITSSVTFTPVNPTETSGKIKVPFKFNVTDVQENVYLWEQTVVFEDLLDNGMLVVSHADIKDEDQRVIFPSLHTSLREAETGVQHVDTYDKDLKLIDTVSYTNLKIGKTYRIIGKLINQETGEVIKDGDKEVTSTVTFTPTKNGDVFKFETTSAASTSSSTSTSTGSSSTTSSSTSSSTPATSTTTTGGLFDDYVSGSVEVVFTFNGKNAGLIAEDGHNAPIVAYEYLYDDFDIKKLDKDSTEDGFVDLYKGVKLWSKHNDKTDVEQTITVPTGHTTFTDNVTSAHVPTVTDIVTMTDKISYRGLLVGKTYVATGTLYIPKDQATDAELVLVEKDENGNECCPLLDENGKMIQGSTTFVAEKSDGEVEVSFTFNKSLITRNKKQIVAFEDISVENEGSVFTHKSITDKDQTVYLPDVHTTALSEDTKDHLAGAYPRAKIIDTVQVSNLESNRKYKLVGVLMNQADGNPFVVGGKEITAETEFESKTDANSFDGTVDVIFEFDAQSLAGKTTVVYETLYIKKIDEKGNETDEWVECGNHKDIEDEGQTVHFSDLHTTALGKDTLKHKVDCKKKVTIVDTVSFTNLIPGKQYRISGLLMAIPKDMSAKDLDTVEIEDGKSLSDYTVKFYPDKNLYVDINGYKCKPLKVNGKTIAGEVTFTAAEPDGKIDVKYTFDASDLQGRTIVVFEDLYNENGVLIGSHADITDKGQTVKVKTPGTPGEDTPSIDTGDRFPRVLVIVLAIIFMFSIIGLLVAKKKFSK